MGGFGFSFRTKHSHGRCPGQQYKQVKRASKSMCFTSRVDALFHRNALRSSIETDFDTLTRSALKMSRFSSVLAQRSGAREHRSAVGGHSLANTAIRYPFLKSGSHGLLG
jgi:hypothetical protein